MLTNEKMWEKAVLLVLIKDEVEFKANVPVMQAYFNI